MGVFSMAMPEILMIIFLEKTVSTTKKLYGF